MKSAKDVDKNMTIPAPTEKDGFEFYNVTGAPFQLFGIFHDGTCFRRMPEETAQSISDGVHILHANTAGGRIRFSTNSKKITINAKMQGIEKLPHFSLCGTAGFDMYIVEGSRECFCGTFIPPYDIENGYESTLTVGPGTKDITINFPLFSGVTSLSVGIEKGSALAECKSTYENTPPIVFYGSSVTHGACASRPGNAYPAMISRKLNRDYINLGFSGSARGESAMADYIASLDMSLFVMDYDFNAPNYEHLKATHFRFYEKIRKAHPDIPIIMVSASTGADFMDDIKGRKRIIYENQKTAAMNGDYKTYFIDGETIFINKRDGTVEGCHPNDLGFSYMAEVIGEKIAKVSR